MYLKESITKTLKTRTFVGLFLEQLQSMKIIEELTYTMGRPILSSEYEEKVPVIVIDNITAGKIFGNSNPSRGKNYC